MRIRAIRDATHQRTCVPESESESALARRVRSCLLREIAERPLEVWIRGDFVTVEPSVR
jgi:hypothetical protein